MLRHKSLFSLEFGTPRQKLNGLLSIFRLRSLFESPWFLNPHIPTQMCVLQRQITVVGTLKRLHKNCFFRHRIRLKIKIRKDWWSVIRKKMWTSPYKRPWRSIATYNFVNIPWIFTWPGWCAEMISKRAVFWNMQLFKKTIIKEYYCGGRLDLWFLWLFHRGRRRWSVSFWRRAAFCCRDWGSHGASWGKAGGSANFGLLWKMAMGATRFGLFVGCKI